MSDVAIHPRFDIGRVVARTFGVLRRNFGPMVLLSLLFSGGPQLIVGLVRYQLYRADVSWTEGFVLTLADVFVSVGGWAILQGAILDAAMKDLSGERVSTSRMFEVGFRLAVPMAGLCILMMLAIIVGLAILIVPGLIIMTVFLVAGPALVAEHLGLFASLSRSRDLTRNHRWLIFLLVIIFAILTLIVAAVLAVAGTGALIVAGFESLAAGAVVMPFVAMAQGMVASVAVVALYVELRALKEGAAPLELARVFD